MTAGLRHFPGDPARPALALHCMMGSAASWGAVVERLGGRIDVTAPDLPLHGRGPAWQAGGESFADATLRLAQPLAETLAARAADGRIDLIGHSFGAVAALRLALHAPARVRSLTLIEPVLFAALPAPERRVPAGLAKAAGKVIEWVWEKRPGKDEPPMTAFLAEQLSTAHWFDQRQTRELLDWTPRVSIEEGMERLREHYRPE